MNRQQKNVGNLGDILKHAALVQLLSGFAARELLYVDTHAFLPSAPCPDPERWRAEVAELSARHPAYLRYVEAQRELARGLYRCSTGLALDLTREVERRALVLGERDEQTRESLRGQLAAEGAREVVLLEDAVELERARLPFAPERVFALVDPFELDDAVWTAVERGLRPLVRDAEAVVEVFTYRREGRHPWPRSLADACALVATVSSGPFQLAAYASPGERDRAGARLTALGWAAAG